MIALLALGERFVAHRPLHFLDADDWAYRRNGRVVANDARRAEVLCFGDSQVQSGVVPRAVGERSGRRVLNFALAGGQAPASYFLLRRALAAGARLDGVVVDFAPALLMEGPRHNRARWPFLVSLSEAAQLAWWARDPELFGQLALATSLPSLRERTAVRDTILAALRGQFDWRFARNLIQFRHWEKNDGAAILAASEAAKRYNEADILRFERILYRRWQCHPANARAIEGFLELADAHGIPVYWVLPPLITALGDRVMRSGFDAEHRAFIHAWQARFPKLYVLDGQSTVSDTAAFYDASHLSASGAYGFSLALGDVLRRSLPSAAMSLATPRWVAVPRCRPVPPPAGIEDLEQSALAVKANWAARY
jgi:hypothetical protein